MSVGCNLTCAGNGMRQRRPRLGGAKKQPLAESRWSHGWLKR